MTISVYQNAVAPESYVLDVTPATSGLDLSTVTAAVFRVSKPDGTLVTWAAARSNQTATTLTLSYTLLAADTAIPGTAIVYAALTVPSGTARTEPRKMFVHLEYEAP